MAAFLEGSEEEIGKLTPEDFALICAAGVQPASEENVQGSADTIGGTVEEWTTVWTIFNENAALIACSMAE